MRAISLLSVFTLLSLFWSCEDNAGRILQSDGTERFFEPDQKPFYHGIASGDPLFDRVIIWTRVTPAHHQRVKVSWEVAGDMEFSDVVQKGNTATDSTKDYTVKVDVTGLSPQKEYFFRFKAFNVRSPTGRTKTAHSEGTDPINIGVVSCSNYEFGYFSGYRHLAEKKLDVVLHLGDYFYEYGPGTYGDTSLNRKHLPPYEIISLNDYRTRYAQYRLDKDLQYIHGRHPFITIWDDHEISNNSYKSGAQNHQTDEGDYEVRKTAAKKAYYEWMPVRPSEREELYRSLKYGPLVDIIMLDERLAGRVEQAASVDDIDTSFTMLGSTQLKWFQDQLKGSRALWKIIGNQVIFSELDLSQLRPKSPKNLDAWDGYAYERNAISNFIGSNKISNVVFVTGDTHSSWAFEVPYSIQDYEQSGRTVATEFGTTSITSANWNESSTDDEVLEAEKVLTTTNPHLKFVNGRDHGYLILTLTEEDATASWYYVDDIREVDSGEKLSMTASVTANKGRITFRD